MIRHRFFIFCCFASQILAHQSFSQTVPTALTAQMVSNSGFEAVWLPASGITHYQLEVSVNSDFTQSKIFTANANDIPLGQTLFGPDGHIAQSNGAIWYTVAQLSASTTYYYRVGSLSNGVVTSYSEVIEVITSVNPSQVAPLNWVHTVAAAGGLAEVQSMIGDDDGNIYAAGHFVNDLIVGTKTLVNHGGHDMFIMKLNADGNVIWVESIGGSGDDGEASLAIDSSGLYMTAIFRNTIDVDPGEGVASLSDMGTHDGDGFCVKFKLSDGALIWANQLVDAYTWAPSSIGLDKSGVYISGYFFGSSNLGTSSSQFTSNGENDIFFGKYDLTNGSALWVNAVGGPHFDGARSQDVGPDGLFVAGFFNGDGDWNTGTINGTVDFDPGTGDSDLSPGGGFFAKYSLANGSLIFAKGFTGTSDFMCNTWTVDVNKSDVYVSGNFHGTINFGSTPDFQKTANDIGAFIGSYNSADGNANWVKNLQTVHFIQPRKLLADNAGFYLSGAFGQSVNFDPAGSDAGLRTSLIGYDNFMARYKPDGTFDWVKTLYVVSIAPAARTSDGYFLGGTFWNQLNFDPYQGNSNYSPAGNDMFIAKYTAVSPPFTPKALDFSNSDTASFVASWKSVAGATAYSLDLSTDNFDSFVSGYKEVTVETTSKKISGLDRGVTYFYRVRATNSFGASDNSGVVKAITKCADKPSIGIDRTDPLHATLTSSSSSGNQWFLNGMAITDATNRTLSVTKEGSYTVQVTVSNCKTEMSESQIVVVTGIERNTASQQGIEVFPNPAGDMAFISLERLTASEPAAIEVFDMMGKNLKSIEAMGGSIVPLDLSNHSQGIYLIRAVQAGKAYHFKLVKP
jgi:hypothetical protein